MVAIWVWSRLLWLTKEVWPIQDGPVRRWLLRRFAAAIRRAGLAKEALEILERLQK